MFALPLTITTMNTVMVSTNIFRYVYAPRLGPMACQPLLRVDSKLKHAQTPSKIAVMVITLLSTHTSLPQAYITFQKTNLLPLEYQCQHNGAISHLFVPADAGPGYTVGKWRNQRHSGNSKKDAMEGKRRVRWQSGVTELGRKQSTGFRTPTQLIAMGTPSKL